MSLNQRITRMVPYGRESIVRALSLGRIGDPEISGVYDGVRKGLEDVVKKLFIVSSENQQSLNFSSPPMKTQKHALRFKITLLGHSPRVWRRIEVPSTYSFWDLHVAIQDAMGWLDCHLHNFMFRVGTNRIDIGIPERGDTETTQLRGWDVNAAEYFTEVGSVAQYEYDFGDSWVHEVRLEKYLPQVPGTKYPRCTGGAGACPPEDCGGVSGYADLLRVLRKPSHEDYESTVGWLNAQTRKKWPYDLKAFDPTKVRFDNPRARFRKSFS